MFQTDPLGSKYRQRLDQVALNNGRSLVIDFEDLINYDPSLARSVAERPDEYIGYATSAATAQMQVEDPEYAERFGKVFARFRALPEEISLRKIGVEHNQKLVQVSGIVSKVGRMYPLILRAAFRCKKCLEISQEGQSGDILRGPGSVCPYCRQHTTWELLEELSKFRNNQELRISDHRKQNGRIYFPTSTLDVRVEDDLVDTVGLKESITLTAIVRIGRPPYSRRRLKKFDFYLEANYLDRTVKDFRTP